MQSPENWFEDADSGQLSNGSARIELYPTFARTVNAGVEYLESLPKTDSEVYKTTKRRRDLMFTNSAPDTPTSLRGTQWAVTMACTARR